MGNYYEENLSGERLKLCYELAPPRIKQYLRAEVDFVKSRLKPESEILELGCGYGRFMSEIGDSVKTLTGIDVSILSLQYGREHLDKHHNYDFACMFAALLGFVDNSFDCILCIQNGLSAFHADQSAIIKECVRVCKPSGQVICSSYSDKIWEERINWFEIQSRAGLVGEIDASRSGNGTIICKDGFSATTVTREMFRELTSGMNVNTEILEVDGSSVFCIIRPC